MLKHRPKGFKGRGPTAAVVRKIPPKAEELYNSTSIKRNVQYTYYKNISHSIIISSYFNYIDVTVSVIGHMSVEGATSCVKPH